MAETVSVREAAAIVGLSYKTMLGLVRAGTVEGRQVRRLWRVDVGSLEAWASAARVTRLGPTTPGPSRRSNVDVLEAVLARPGWDIDRVAEQVRVNPAKVARWPAIGVPNVYVKALRHLVEGD